MASSLKSQLNTTVYRGSQGSGAYVWSPFVTKLEARLRFAGLPYRTEAGSIPNAPRGKIPYVSVVKTDGGSPTILADSTLIIQKFVEDGALDDLNANFSPLERAHDLALRALLEEKLYFYQVGVIIQVLALIRRLTAGFPIARYTKDGTKTTIPCALKSSQHFPTPSN